MTSEECRDVLERVNIRIHIESGDIFVNNQNTNESIYDFLLNQQDERRKKLPVDFPYDDDYTDYITKYLPSINEADNDKFDVLSNKNSKYLFHLFNKYQESRNKPKQYTLFFFLRTSKILLSFNVLIFLPDLSFKCSYSCS